MTTLMANGTGYSDNDLTSVLTAETASWVSGGASVPAAAAAIAAMTAVPVDAD